MTTLRVILDDVGHDVRSSLAWYGEELTRALIATAPTDLDVAAFTAAVSNEREERIRRLLPGLVELEQAKLPEREMREAWLHSITTLHLPGLTHATSLFAPLRSHSEEDGQTVVTVHADAPLSDRGSGKVRWFDKALKRAWKHADGVVVPTDSVAVAINEIHDFGERMRVIPGGIADVFRAAPEDDERARQLGLPERFVAVMTAHGSLQTGIDLIALLSDIAMPDVPVVVVGPVAWDNETLSAMAVSAGIPVARFVPVGEVCDRDLAVVLSRASAYVHLQRHDGFALPMLAAFSLGCPVAYAATPALDEVADNAALGVAAAPDGNLSRPLAEAVRRLLDEDALAGRLAALGQDRARYFDWRTAAEQVWQFHAQL